MIKLNNLYIFLGITISIFLFLPLVLAQTFNDVSTEAWYFDYVEEMVEKGVVDAGGNFRPDDPINRAELVKIVITAIDGLSYYEAPARPTFDDVSINAWYYNYIEDATQLDIVKGYTDEAGNLTRKFGPSNDVTRAEAIKIIIRAFGYSIYPSPVALPFSDVSKNAWYYDYISTAYNQNIISGYENGMFGPNDNVTRAQISKIVINAWPIIIVDPPLKHTVCGDGVCEGAESAFECDDELQECLVPYILCPEDCAEEN